MSNELELLANPPSAATKNMRELLPEELELIVGAQGDTKTSSSSSSPSKC